MLGYLSRDQQRNRGKYLSGDVIYDRYKGAAGLEQVFNQDLTGKDGRFMISTTPDGYARSAAVAEPATYGNNVRLSIDSKIQAAVEAAMAASPNPMKAAVMMDIHTGDVVAMASHPTFDPNIFVPSIAADEWDALNDGEYNPLLDRTHPRAISARLRLQDGHVDRGDEGRRLRSELGRPLHRLLRSRQHAHGPQDRERRRDLPRGAAPIPTTPTSATLGLKIGRDVLLDTARSLNFGSLTTIDLPGELPGFIPDPESVRRMHQREFQVAGGDTALTAIGQGDVLVTPLQMADFMAALANDGTVYRPRLVKQIEDRNGNVIKAFPVETLRTVTFDDKWMPDSEGGHDQRHRRWHRDRRASRRHEDRGQDRHGAGRLEGPPPPDRVALRLSSRR